MTKATASRSPRPPSSRARTSIGGGVIFEERFETPGLTTRTTIGGSRCASPVTGPWRSPAWTSARCSLAARCCSRSDRVACGSRPDGPDQALKAACPGAWNRSPNGVAPPRLLHFSWMRACPGRAAHARSGRSASAPAGELSASASPGRSERPDEGVADVPGASLAVGVRLGRRHARGDGEGRGLRERGGCDSFPLVGNRCRHQRPCSISSSGVVA